MFYVYALIDPRTGSPFYIGKGKGRRASEHEKEAKKGAHSQKCHVIRSIWADGLKVERQIISMHEDENEAFAYEAALIEQIGLSNLTNVLPGGLIGQQVYLERQQRAKERAAQFALDVHQKWFEKMAPKFARMFAAIQDTGGFGFSSNGRWLDVGEPLVRLFWEMVGNIGQDRAREVMLRHGVQIAS